MENSTILVYNVSAKKVKVPPVDVIKAYWGSRGLAPLILDVGSRRRWVVSLTPRERTPMPID